MRRIALPVAVCVALALGAGTAEVAVRPSLG